MLVYDLNILGELSSLTFAVSMWDKWVCEVCMWVENVRWECENSVSGK